MYKINKLIYNDNQNNIDNNDDIMESDGNDIEWDTDLDNDNHEDDDDGSVIVQDMDPNVETEIVQVSFVCVFEISEIRCF